MFRLLLLTFPIVSFGQTINLTSSCSYYGEKLPTTISISYSDFEAQTSLNKILSASGLPTNFTLVSGNIPNACATLKYNEASKSLERFIIYNPTFMKRVKNNTNDWAALSILAHEVGHHLSGHSLRVGGSRPDLELEADRFSGFILYKLGATIDEATAAMNLLSNPNGTITHPSKFLRISAIREGWFNSKGAGPENSQSNARKPNKIGRYSDENGSESNDVYWTKTGNNSFELTCQGYKFSSSEVTIFNSCENLIVFMNDYDKYFYLEDFTSKSISNTIYKVKPTCPYVCYSKHVLVKTINGFWILYRGQNVKVLEQTSQYSDWFGNIDVMKLANGATVKFLKSDYDKASNCIPIDPYGSD
jgi:hypothetical protein